MNAKQFMKKYIEKLVSKVLPDNYLEDDGRNPTSKFSAIRKSAVEKLTECLEKMLKINCESCSREIDVEEEDYQNCDKCESVCCTDCICIFSIKEMEDKNGNWWKKCEVCTECNEELENADDEEEEKIIQDMEQKHEEPDSDGACGALSEEDTTKEEHTMDIQQAKEIFLNHYFVSHYCIREDLVEYYGVPAGEEEAFEEYFVNCDAPMEEVLKDIVVNFQTEIGHIEEDSESDDE